MIGRGEHDPVRFRFRRTPVFSRAPSDEALLIPFCGASLRALKWEYCIEIGENFAWFFSPGKEVWRVREHRGEPRKTGFWTGSDPVRMREALIVLINWKGWVLKERSIPDI